MISHAATLASSIASGDVSSAETYFRGWCAGRVWLGAEATSIRNACATWGVDPARFGVAPKRAPEPWTWPVRAHFMCDPIPAFANDGDFQRASMQAASHYPEPAYTWRLEAIRWRMGHPGAALDLPAIEASTLNMLAIFARRES